MRYPARMANVGKSEKKTRVVLLFGGRSAEHEISLLSARNVLRALDTTRFDPLLIGIDKQGRWHRESAATLDAAAGDPRQARLDPNAPVVEPTTTLSSEDVVFPVLHGTYGEDGTIQGLLELLDVAYVGAGVLGSAVGMDKDVAKRLLRDAHIPIVDFRVVTARQLRDDRALALARVEELGYPLFCKPANAGSSVGVSRVASRADLEKAVTTALAYDRKMLAERAVNAREVECAVLGNETPEASIPGEILVQHKDGFYSYDAKYIDPQGATVRMPADLPPDVTQRIRELSVATFLALELEGMARVDFFVDRVSSEVFVNEVNTIPGFTAISMYPKMWEATGLPPAQLVTKLIDLAIERQAARRAFSTSATTGMLR